MRDLIALLKEAGINSACLVRLTRATRPTVYMSADYVRFYHGTAVDKEVSKLIDDGLVSVEFENGAAYITLGENQ